MPRREYYHSPPCVHEGCTERACFVFERRADQDLGSRFRMPLRQQCGSVTFVRVYRLGRWWKLTERAALRMVWSDFGWTHLPDVQERATYTKAKVGYWVTLTQEWPEA